MLNKKDEDNKCKEKYRGRGGRGKEKKDAIEGSIEE
jgi:hypothetical protein